MRNLIMAAAGGEVDMSKYFEWLNSDYSIGNAVLVALLGIAVVFTILVVLVLILTLFQKIFTIKVKGKNTEKQTSDGASEAIALQTQDEETVAAITAAVSLLIAEENGGEAPQFTVRRIRQVNQIRNR